MASQEIASQEKAFSLEKTPNLHRVAQRKEIVSFARKCLPKSRSFQKVNQFVDGQIRLLDSSEWKRSVYRKHQTMEGYIHGREAKDATALFDRPTDGGADNLHNFLQTETRGKSYTSEELKALIAGRFPDRNLETQYKRATDPSSNMMKWHKAVKRWQWAFDDASKLEDLEPDLENGSKHAERLKLYGDMPRRKHKPGDKYSAEASEVLQYIGQRSGETDFAKLAAEYNNIPRAWINSKTGERDSDRNIARANMIYDRATGETMGPLTYREELKQPDDVCDDAPRKVVEEVEEAEEPEADRSWIQEGYDYFVEGPNDDDYAIGSPGRRRVLDPDAITRIEELGTYDEKDAHKEITKILKEYAVSGIKVEAFVKNAIELCILKWVNGDDLEGYQTYRSSKTREKYGWPDKLSGEVGPELVFQGMAPSSSIDPFTDRAQEFIDMYRLQLDGNVFAKNIVRDAWKEKLIVKIDDIYQLAA
jgi:hypothetical protein